MIYRRRTAWSAALALILAMTLFAGAALAAEPGEGTTVHMGKASWASAEPVAAVVSLLLQELGYEVDGPRLFASNPVAYLAIANGDLDVFPNGWFPLHNPQLPRNFEATGAFAGTLCEGCTLEGYLVGADAARKYNIKTLADFMRPDVKAAFDANGDGKADLFGCPPGWGCHEVIEYHLDAYQLRDHINHVTADYTAGFANAQARIEAGQPTLYYTWAPNNTVLELVPGEDVVWIGVPYVDKAPAHEPFDWQALFAEGLEGAVTDPLNMGYVSGDIRIVANQEFLDENPAAASLLSDITLDLTWINEATVEFGEGGDVEEIAAEWIESNRDTVDAWLNAARAAAN